ncbi:hypothetical protein GQ53DRAFT_886027 [Thozetella sp. PMI_491]|nr:hypothetical protein GQ53DRAFT_886027 [Thozetella sp. PMI_491]
MSHSAQITLNGSDGLLTAVFGEATPEQQLNGSKLAAAAFRGSFAEHDYLDREEYLAQQPLTRNKGCRFWCIFERDNPSNVLAMCKTIRRDLIVRDTYGTHNQRGYCIASVVTSAPYRRQGIASLLLREVAAWVDGPGGAEASILSIPKGARRCTILSKTTLSSRGLALADLDGQRKTRLLTGDEISRLRARDVQLIQTSFEKLEVGKDEVHMAVAPTGDLASLKDYGRVPQFHGTLCEDADAWMFWFHDFRKQQLAIQRLRCPSGEEEIQAQIVASLLHNALEESVKWNLPRVVIWDTNDIVTQAIRLLEETAGIEVRMEGQSRKSVTSVRWKWAGEKKAVTVHINEFYEWS